MRNLILLFVFLITSCATAPHVSATICYLPFDRETFGPVDRKLIEKEKCTDVDYTDILYKKLWEYLSYQNQGPLESSDQHFDEKRVRLKFVGENDTYYVDADGDVVVGNQQYRLSDDNKRAISKILASLLDYND